MSIAAVSAASSAAYIQQPQATSQAGTQDQTAGATQTPATQQAAAAQQPDQVHPHHHHHHGGGATPPATTGTTQSSTSTSIPQTALDMLA